MYDEKITISNVKDIFSVLPNINIDTNFWMVRANKGEYYEDFILNQYVGLGFNEISLKEAQTQTNETLHTLFKERKPKDKAGREIPTGTYTSWIGQLKRFANELNLGDYVLVPSKSSERFSLGIITSTPKEYTSQEIESIEKVAGRKNSSYHKRISVQFLKAFNRNDADPALYKMIYTQTTLSKINKYVPFILRATYDAYVADDKLYLTFPVKQKEDVKGRPFTSFTYHMTESYYQLTNEDPVIKSNVQCEGIVQFILALSPMAGVFIILLTVLKNKKGFTVDINLKEGKFRFTKEDDGIIAERISQNNAERTIHETDKKLEQINKTIELMNKAGFSMDEIKAKVSEELNEATRKVNTPKDDDDIQK